MLQNYKKRESGFTIIEVLIVLAIAGLILVIVFLAVPNLQRNARNTSRKDEASRIASAASNFVSNDNGSLPSSGTDAAAILEDSGTLKQYQFSGSGAATTAAAGKLTVVTGTSANTTFSGGLLADSTVAIYTKAKCAVDASGNPIAGTVGVAGNRQMAILYTIETKSSFQPVCLDI